MKDSEKEFGKALVGVQAAIHELEMAFERMNELILQYASEFREIVNSLNALSLERYERHSVRNPYPPYRERLHPRPRHAQKPYWFRIRSNPQKRGYHRP